MIDFDKPVRTVLDQHPVEILRANLPPPYVAVGLIYRPRPDGKKGLVPQIALFGADGLTLLGLSEIEIENYEPAAADYIPRSLRVDKPDAVFQTRSGSPAEFIKLDPDGCPIFGFWANGGRHIAVRNKDGMINGKPHPLDIVEVTQPITRYVRVYDKPKTAKNPSCLSNAYEFGTLAEAKAELQGVRAIGVLVYKEGDYFDVESIAKGVFGS